MTQIAQELILFSPRYCALFSVDHFHISSIGANKSFLVIHIDERGVMNAIKTFVGEYLFVFAYRFRAYYLLTCSEIENCIRPS
jgi:hypothetical protein